MDFYPILLVVLVSFYPSHSFPQSQITQFQLQIQCPCDPIRSFDNDFYRECLIHINLNPFLRRTCSSSSPLQIQSPIPIQSPSKKKPEGQYPNCGEEPKNFDKTCCEEFRTRILAEREEMKKEGYTEVRSISLYWAGTHCEVYESDNFRSQTYCSDINSSSECCNESGCNWITQRRRCGQATITERRGLLRGTYIKTHNKPC